MKSKFVLMLLIWGLVTTPLIGRAAAVSPQTFLALDKAEKLLDQKAYQQAIGVLQARLKAVTNKPLEKALLLRALASAFTARGDYRRAIAYLEQALASDGLSEIQKNQVLRTLGQLYLAENKPRKAMEILKSWLESASETKPDDYLLLAQAYTQLKRYREALRYLNLAISKAPKPKESWIQLRLGLHYQLKDFSAAITDLHQLIRIQPTSKKYWDQLAAMYQLARQPLTAAAVKELEALAELLTSEPEILQGVQLLRAIHAPFIAGSRLEKAIQGGQIQKNHKNLKVLADCWTEAREFDRAIDVLQQAAPLGPSGKLYFRLGQLYVEREQWQKAVSSLRKALEKGRLDKPGQAWLLLGNCYFEVGQLDSARKAFNQALRFEYSRKPARQWLNFLAQPTT